jgi:hypothetical protein
MFNKHAMGGLFSSAEWLRDNPRVLWLEATQKFFNVCAVDDLSINGGASRVVTIKFESNCVHARMDGRSSLDHPALNIPSVCAESQSRFQKAIYIHVNVKMNTDRA